MECLDLFFEQAASKNYDIKIYIKSKKTIDENTIYFIAPNPPDYRTSFSGSALPFPSKSQAFDDTTNKGKLVLNSENEGVIYLKYPNAYYMALGNVLVLPHVDLIFTVNNIENVVNYKLSDNPIPYRTLTHPHTRTSPLFYKKKTEIPIMSQRDLLKRNGYPVTNKSTNEFW